MGDSDGLWSVFDYEWKMASELWRYLSPEELGRYDLAIQNAVVESLVLHSRILVEILISKGSGDDDIRLDKLMPSFRSVKVAELTKVYGRNNDNGTPCWQFNKLLAHATTQRKVSHDYIEPLKKVWHVMTELLDEVMKYRQES